MKVTRCVVAAFFLAVSARGADEVIALKAARIFDGKSNALVQNGVVLVEGDKIVDAGSNLRIPSSARVIDLGDATLCPGLWMPIPISPMISPAITMSGGCEKLT